MTEEGGLINVIAENQQEDEFNIDLKIEQALDVSLKQGSQRLLQSIIKSNRCPICTLRPPCKHNNKVAPNANQDDSVIQHPIENTERKQINESKKRQKNNYSSIAQSTLLSPMHEERDYMDNFGFGRKESLVYQSFEKARIRRGPRKYESIDVNENKRSRTKIAQRKGKMH